MRQRLAFLSFVIAMLLVASASGQAPQAPAPGGSGFAGRWEFVMQAPGGAANPFEGEGIPLALIDIAGDAASPTGKLIDTMGGGLMNLKLVEVSVKDDQLTVVLEMSMGKPSKMTIQLKRVGDHLEGPGTAEGEKETGKFLARSTTVDKLALPKMRPPAADQKAYTAAMTKPPKERTEALKQFLKDYPDYAMKEQANLQLAQSYQTADEKIAALRKFIEDFPNTKLKDEAQFQIAFAPTKKADKAVTLQKFIEEFPKSPLKQRAEYELTLTISDATERDAAQETFAKANPKSSYASTINRSLLESYAKRKPLDEAKLTALVDGLVSAAPATTIGIDGIKITQINGRAAMQNTVADRLMVNEVMLDKALIMIREAVAAAGEKEPARYRAMYTTTLGQVLYKLKDYAKAEVELKKAIEIGGADSDGEALLFLGKTYEATGKDDAALKAYFDAATIASSKDTKTSLERMWAKKNGSLAGLDAKLDDIYKARPKAIEAGHYTPDAAKKTGRVVLAELFTGAECGPCVAADLAFDGLSERYDHSTVAVLVYHMHIPGPDPMTNTDTEARGTYYDVNGTPTFTVDGLAPQSGGGGTAQAAAVFSGLKTKVESRIAVAPLAALNGFKAKVSGETIKVSGQAALLGGGIAGKVRKPTLHVALVQDLVRYTGANGVRFHTFVVRKLLGSPAGTPLQAAGKKTKFSESVNVTKLGESLDAYLTKFEKDRSAARGEFSFQDKVAKLDPKQLLVVAFVQDDQTKEILQSVFITPSR